MHTDDTVLQQQALRQDALRKAPFTQRGLQPGGGQEYGGAIPMPCLLSGMERKTKNKRKMKTNLVADAYEATYEKRAKKVTLSPFFIAKKLV